MTTLPGIDCLLESMVNLPGVDRLLEGKVFGDGVDGSTEDFSFEDAIGLIFHNTIIISYKHVCIQKYIYYTYSYFPVNTFTIKLLIISAIAVKFVAWLASFGLFELVFKYTFIDLFSAATFL